jgi:hypothetical protein
MSKHQHLKDSNESYWSHTVWAVGAGFQLIWAGIVSLIHAVYPGWFPFHAAKTVIDLYYKRLHNHSNPSYREYIKKIQNHNDSN